ncbi:hypothetical protein Ping_2466 [Psychromonas ingrahamii 37]|uniref:Uncharacterized protein n=1 Tax=Psychromonas ingrahamii (strain DSM 17664 / CCUG 51855 / 37) TaxID=357804 RepID=A1SXI2_PSYIN|nr:hypothetical protein [Psychromonas ingrahamii]ABM04197.1 hypothetical protein Ping_2466 [Psychromonas ingrahamii 37]
MFIKLSPSNTVLPLTFEDDLNTQQEAELLAQCPTIDLTQVSSKEQVTQHLIDLFAYYFQLPTELINEQSDIVNDIERYVWARDLGVTFEDVTYGRIFCGNDNEGNLTGGIEDRGIMIATMYMTDFPDLIGIKVIDDRQNATFEAEDDEFGSYYDCNTVNELSTLVFSVCKKLNAA